MAMSKQYEIEEKHEKPRSAESHEGVESNQIGKVGQPEKVLGHLHPRERHNTVAMAVFGKQDSYDRSLDKLFEKGKNTSASFNHQVKQEIRELPPGLTHLLDKHGYKFVTAHHVTEAVEELKKVKPREWKEGSSFDHTDGIPWKSDKVIVMAEYHWNTAKHNWEPNTRLGGVLRHEMSHVLDDLLGESYALGKDELERLERSGKDTGKHTHELFTQTPEFIRSYNKDIHYIRSHLSKEEQTRLTYYMTKFGPEESFAEVSALLLGETCNKGEKELIAKAFPEVTSVVKKRLAEVELIAKRKGQ